MEGVTEPVSMATIDQLICVGGGAQQIVLGPEGAVLALGPEPRFFSPAQKRAMMVRDGGCAIPGCTVPARLTEAHHLVAWKPDGKGGATDISNGILLCERHHHLLHALNWQIRMIRGKPYLLAPPEMDPTRTWQPLGRTRAVMRPNPPDYRT